MGRVGPNSFPQVLQLAEASHATLPVGIFPDTLGGAQEDTSDTIRNRFAISGNHTGYVERWFPGSYFRDNQYAVNVIGHHYKSVHSQFFTAGTATLPLKPYIFTEVIQDHPVAVD